MRKDKAGRKKEFGTYPEGMKEQTVRTHLKSIYGKQQKEVLYLRVQCSGGKKSRRETDGKA